MSVTSQSVVGPGEDVLTLRFEERRTQKLFLNTECVTQRKMDTASHGRRLGGAVPGAPPSEWRRRMKMGVKKVGQRIGG